jgi:hypothetical protein
MELKYDISKVDPDERMTVKVDTPDDQNREMALDAGSLQ